MRNLFLSIASCFAVTFLTSNLQVPNNELCSGDYLLSDLLADKTADDESLVYMLNEKLSAMEICQEKNISKKVYPTESVFNISKMEENLLK